MADTPIKDYEKLDAQSKATIAANARSQGITPQEYLTSRGGVFKSGYYGDTPEFRRLSETDYAAASAKGSGAINTALFNQIRESYKNNPNLIEDPYLRLAYQNKAITLDQLMQGLYPGMVGQRGFGTLATGQTRQSIGAMADGTPIYGFGSDGKPITDPNGTIYSTTSASDAVTKFNSGSQPLGFGSSTTDTAATADPAMIALIQSLQNQIAFLTAGNSQAAIDKAAADAAAKKEKAESAIAVLTDRFSRYGLASLVPKIRELAISGAGESTITLQLQETEEYRQRFRANQDRIKKGLSVLDPGDYLGLEDDYRQILRAYGLKQFDNDDYVTQFISNDISTTELSNRVATAVQRVQNADPAILTTLRSFYGISDNDLVAYVLDPNQQFQKIERQVAAAEIGAAAKLQGINAGVTVSEQLAAQGVTKAQAQKGYATIADILPTAEKLSDIYGKTLDEYRLGEAEQEVFNTLASAQRKRQKLVQTEIAAFSGASGLGKSSLSSQLGGTF